MGCCSDDKNCAGQRKKRRPFPWFGAILVLLVVLVVLNWQG